jgi:hypothetical protein
VLDEMPAPPDGLGGTRVALGADMTSFPRAILTECSPFAEDLAARGLLAGGMMATTKLTARTRWARPRTFDGVGV